MQSKNVRVSLVFHQVRLKDHKVRAFPYPFLGALSISNDIEFFDFTFFEVLMKFLNTNQATPFGTGLGLEVTSSFFFNSAHPYTFSYFLGLGAQVSEVATRVDDYLRAGLIDANHAYGDFDNVGGFTRQHALSCYEVLGRLGVQIKVFTNHGGVDNIQNVGTDAAYHRGDLTDNQAYHVDLMKGNGVRYVWTDSMITEQVPPANGRARWLKRRQNTGLLKDCVLQDGSLFKGFTRLRATGANAPNLSSLEYQLRLVDWKRFYSEDSAVVVYQHFGVLHRVAGKCYQATSEAVRDRPEVFLAPFRILERECKEGRLWVCGLSRFLQYIDMVESLEIKFGNISGDYYIIGSASVGDPELFFQGLTFYINPRKITRLYYIGQELPLVYNGPDETGRYSATVPFKKLPDIW